MAPDDGVDLGIAGLGPAQVIGEGGNAFVYRCRQESLDRDVAVKILKRASDEGTQRRFSREQRAMGRMSQHDGIVTVYESGITTMGEPYLVMPLLPGSLNDELESRGALPWAEAVDVVTDVAETVQFAHEQGLVHRDLKPANLMRSLTGRALVADFGISRIVDSGASMQSAALTLTPAFSPPESLSGAEAEPTTDVYALGATLYALIEGHPPFVDSITSSNLLALLRRVTDEPVPTMAADVPEWIDAVVAASMTKDPALRIQSCAELAAHLRSKGSGLPTPAESATAPAPSDASSTIMVGGAAPAASIGAASPVAPAVAPTADSREPARNPWWKAAAAAAVVALIVAGAVVLANRGGDGAEEAQTPPGTTRVSEPDASAVPAGSDAPPVSEAASASDPADPADPVEQPLPTELVDEGLADDPEIAAATSAGLLPSDFGMGRVAVSDPVIGFADYETVSDPRPYQPQRQLVGDIQFYVDVASTTNAFYREWLLYASGGDPETFAARAPQSWTAPGPGELPAPPIEARDDPVTGISFDDAAAYCIYVNKRLVTEIEWELAATGGVFLPDTFDVQNWVDRPAMYGAVDPGQIVLRGTFGSESLDNFYRTIGADSGVLRSAAGVRCAADFVRPAQAVDVAATAVTIYEDDFSDLDSGWPSSSPDGVSSRGYHPTDVYHIETEQPWTRVAVSAPEPAPDDSTVTAVMLLRKPEDGFELFSYGLFVRSSDQGYILFTIRPEIDGNLRIVNWCLMERAEPLLQPEERVDTSTGQSPSSTCDGALLGEGRNTVENFDNVVSISFDGATPTITIDGEQLQLPAGTTVGMPAGSVGLYVESFDETSPVHIHYDELVITSP